MKRITELQEATMPQSFIQEYAARDEMSRNERRKLLKEQRGRDFTRVDRREFNIEERDTIRNERLALRSKYLLECAKELGVDRDTVDALMSRDVKTRQKLFGILPDAPYGCRTQECQEQNSASARSIIDFQNSELGKKLECLEQCAESKMFARQNPDRGGGSTKMIEEINYRYNSKCGSFKKANKSEAENKNKNLYLILGAIVVLLILKK
jgi:hypothetical protein